MLYFMLTSFNVGESSQGLFNRCIFCFISGVVRFV